MTARKKVPDAVQDTKEIPSAEMTEKEMPSAKQPEKKIPDAAMPTREVPMVGKPENTVMIGGKLIEIKTTRLKYQRNRTSEFYRYLELYPLTDILAMEADQFGDGRDGDKSVMDWLIAVTDDEELITSHYDELDTETVEKMLEIFKRVNRITEKEAKLKNLERTLKAE